MPIARKILDMLDLGRIAIHVSYFFYSEISKNRKGEVFPLCDDFFRWVSTAPLIAITRNDSFVGTPLKSHTVHPETLDH